MVDTGGFVLTAEHDGLRHIVGVHGGHREFSTEPREDGKAFLEAFVDGEHAPVSRAIDDRRPDDDQPVTKAGSENVFRQTLGPAVGGHRKAGICLTDAFFRAARPCSRKRGDMDESSGAVLAESGAGFRQTGRSPGIGAEVILPAEPEEQSGHVNDGVRTPDSLAEGSAVREADLDGFNGRGKMGNIGCGTDEDGDGSSGFCKQGEKMTSDKTRAAGDENAAAVQECEVHKISLR